MSVLRTLRSWLCRAGAWIRKNWKYILFPVAALSFAANFVPRRRQQIVIDNEADLEHANTIEDKTVERDMKLEQLRRQHEARLATLTEEQLKELEDLQDKSLEEVTKWFDQL